MLDSPVSPNLPARRTVYLDHLASEISVWAVPPSYFQQNCHQKNKLNNFASWFYLTLLKLILAITHLIWNGTSSSEYTMFFLSAGHTEKQNAWHCAFRHVVTLEEPVHDIPVWHRKETGWRQVYMWRKNIYLKECYIRHAQKIDVYLHV